MNIVETGEHATVNVTDPADVSRKSVIEELKELKAAKKNKKYVAPQETNFSLRDLKKKPAAKKEKKPKKKKKQESLPVSEGLMELKVAASIHTDDSDVELFSSGRTISDILADIDNEHDEEVRGLKDMIIHNQKGKHTDRHKDGTRFSKKFADQLTLLYDMLSESNDLSNLLTKQVKTMMGARTRGAISKTTVELASAALSSNNNRLAIIKEINSTNKTISDLELKEEAMDQRSKKEESANPSYAGTNFLQQVLSMGRKNVLGASGVNSGAIQATGEFVYDDDEEEIDADTVDNVLDMMHRSETGYGSMEVEDLQSIIHNRLEKEGNPNRSAEGSTYIQTELQDVKIWVYQCIDTGDWEFIALDKYNQRLYDYPLPSRLDTGKLKFSDDNAFATDEKGRSYKVKTYFSSTPDDNFED